MPAFPDRRRAPFRALSSAARVVLTRVHGAPVRYRMEMLSEGRDN
jgi:hypothetical protein